MWLLKCYKLLLSKHEGSFSLPWSLLAICSVQAHVFGMVCKTESRRACCELGAGKEWANTKQAQSEQGHENRPRILLQNYFSTITADDLVMVRIPWFLTLPGHQQPWYWMCKIRWSFSSIRNDLNFIRLGQDTHNLHHTEREVQERLPVHIDRQH